MKRLFLPLFIGILLLVMSGCKNQPAQNNTNIPKVHQTVNMELNTLKEKIKGDGKLIGVAYLGWLEGDSENARSVLYNMDYIKDISFVKNVEKYAENEGYRMYLIVPADDSISVSVCKCEFDDEYMPYDGQELIEANEPILIRGNMSDTIPNLYVIAKKGSEKVEYTPLQSGMNGRLENSESKVYDFTPYELMPEFCGFDRLPDAVFCGEWTGVTTDGNGEERMLFLSLEPDGVAKYSYGINRNEISEQFEGIWTLDENDILRLELTGGSTQKADELYECNPSFEWEITADGLYLTHIDGDEILFGTSESTFIFPY